MAKKIKNDIEVEGSLDLKHVTSPSNPSTGKLKVYSKNDNKLYKKDSAGNEEEVGSKNNSERLIKEIVQANHGFSVGNVLTIDNNIYVKAIASNGFLNTAVGIVDSVKDANTFVVCLFGHINTLSGLTPNAIYYLSNTIAGEITKDMPTQLGHYQVQLFVATTITAGFFSPSAPVFINATSSPLIKDYLLVTGGTDGSQSPTVATNVFANGYVPFFRVEGNVGGVQFINNTTVRLPQGKKYKITAQAVYSGANGVDTEYFQIFNITTSTLIGARGKAQEGTANSEFPAKAFVETSQITDIAVRVFNERIYNADGFIEIQEI
jgi:hypothetical protein